MAGPTVAPGVYRHFKGKLYEVIGVAREVDTTEAFVIYRPLYGDRELVARPLGNFTETVTIGVENEPRFRQVEAHDALCRSRPDQASKSL